MVTLRILMTGHCMSGIQTGKGKYHRVKDICNRVRNLSGNISSCHISYPQEILVPSQKKKNILLIQAPPLQRRQEQGCCLKFVQNSNSHMAMSKQVLSFPESPFVRWIRLDTGQIFHLLHLTVVTILPGLSMG